MSGIKPSGDRKADQQGEAMRMAERTDRKGGEEAVSRAAAGSLKKEPLPVTRDSRGMEALKRVAVHEATDLLKGLQERVSQMKFCQVVRELRDLEQSYPKLIQSHPQLYASGTHPRALYEKNRGDLFGEPL